jgi:phage terminase large subunit-like protein
LVRIGIETNAYQKAQLNSVAKAAPDLKGVLMPIVTLKDKITRAWNLSKYFDGGKMFFRQGLHHLIEHLVLFPSYRYKDLFDATDLAVTAAKSRRRRTDRTEPGVI